MPVSAFSWWILSDHKSGYILLQIIFYTDGKASAYNVGDTGSIPGSGRSSGEDNSNPLQYSCLGNPMDRGAWWAKVHGVAKSPPTT